MAPESGVLRVSVCATPTRPYPHLVASLQLYSTRCSTGARKVLTSRTTIAISENGTVSDNFRMKFVPVVYSYGPVEEINTIVRRSEDASFPTIPVSFV